MLNLDTTYKEKSLIPSRYLGTPINQPTRKKYIYWQNVTLEQTRTYALQGAKESKDSSDENKPG